MTRNILLVSALLVPAVAHATSTRLSAMGQLNRYVADDANMFRYPNTIDRYGHLFVLDYVGAGVDPVAGFETIQNTLSGGSILRLAEGFTMAVWMSDYSDPALGQFMRWVGAHAHPLNGGFGVVTTPGGVPNWAPAPNLDANGDGAPDTLGPDRKYDLFAAFKVAPDIAAGVHFAFGNTGMSFVPGSNSDGAGQERGNDGFNVHELLFQLGVGGDIDPTTSFDAQLTYANTGVGYTQFDTNPIGGGFGHRLALGGRFMAEVSSYWDIVVAADYQFQGFSLLEDSEVKTLGPGGGPVPKRLPADYVAAHSGVQNLIDIGVGGRLRAAERINGWIIVGFNWIGTHTETDIDANNSQGPAFPNNTKFALDTSVVRLPYVRIAVEAQLHEYFTFRAGGEKWSTYGWRKDDQDFAENNLDKNPEVFSDLNAGFLNTFTPFLGLSAMYKGLSLDVQVNPTWLRNGPNFLTGAAAPWSTRMSLSFAY
jgi:hypothetical protein